MIAILGMGDRVIPDCELWGLAQDPLVHSLSRVFEIHDWKHVLTNPSHYIERLSDIEAPLYMRERQDGLPHSIRYPLEDVIEIGEDYFTSSISYMIALAVLERQEFTLQGCDLSEDRYGHQRECIEFWLGVARGRGVGFELPPSSPFLKFTPIPIEPPYVGRYGAVA